MIRILRKPGWKLNESDKTVTSILTKCEQNGGLCPCVHKDIDENTDLHCPCSDYRLKDKCCCNLYVKDDIDD